MIRAKRAVRTLGLLSLCVALVACGGGANTATEGNGTGGNSVGTGGSSGTSNGQSGSSAGGDDNGNGFTIPPGQGGEMNDILDAEVFGDGGPACGDAIIQAGEECDDGNSLPGDGCNGACHLEPNFSCPVVGQDCVTTVVCGDGVLGGAEICDDGNTMSDDGCVSSCDAVEPFFACPNAGQDCVSLASCGDGRISVGEACDDTNFANGDGCDENCQVEAGFVCPVVGDLCKLDLYCGDGQVTGTEQCDDGGNVSGDGCTATCGQEPFYACAMPGAACTYVVVCGDGKVQDQETCDDNNTDAGDGCDDNCLLEDGWVCAIAGTRCEAAQCGDGIIAGNEECEDGNVAHTGGCDANCFVKSTYACVTNLLASPVSTCHLTVCNDGVKEGSEPCDDGPMNLVVGDGCNPSCEVEPLCPNDGGACSSQCGDGLILPGDNEACDDGNTKDGDGCSHDCLVEEGYDCPLVASALPGSITIPFTFRDFIAFPTQQGITNGYQRHPDFQNGCLGSNGNDTIVNTTLDVDGKPTNAGTCVLPAAPECTIDVGYHAAPGQCDDLDTCPVTVENDCQQSTHPNHPISGHAGDPFSFWYRDEPGVNKTIVVPTVLNGNNGVYSYTNNNLFPLNGKGWVASGDEATYNGGNNYGFTSEVRYWFTFQGGEVLSFTGDDDLYVFVNGKLALSIGNKHGALTRTMTLSAGVGTLADATCAGCAAPQPTVRAIGPMTVGNVYEIAIFHAERQANASNFNLSLTGFVHAKSDCQSVCGDGFVTKDEVCDDSDDTNVVPHNADGYGTCQTNCTRGSYCGDGTVDGAFGEQCDNGVNLSPYGGCAPGCVNGPSCGDGTVQPVGLEECDDGVNNGGYAECASMCKLGLRCGDGVIQTANGEQCDDGVNNGGYAQCAPGCLRGQRCGDGVVQPAQGETCDDGVNDGSYGGCTAGCKQGPRCGDGTKQGGAGEQCDDGVNDGGYGECAPGCKIGARCGDGVRQAGDGEQCDDGVNNGGYGECAQGCKLGPHCGDNVVQTASGEECDDGNQISHDGCSSGCQHEGAIN